MASAGERTCWCEFLVRGDLIGAGEVNPDPATWAVWHDAWAKKRGIRGGEVINAREPQRQTVEEFFFDYPDVMDPIGDGLSLNETMVIRYKKGLYDIDAVFPDETKRREVRVVATSRRLAQ
jgi:Phage head-tail joining protein